MVHGNALLVNKKIMKHLDQFSQRFIAVSLSLMGLMLCATLFMATVGNANASNEPNSNLSNSAQNGSGAAGTIMMDYTSVHVPSQDKTYYEVLVWDSATGVSKLYFYDYTEKTFKSYEDNVQLPKNPLD